MMLVVGGPLSLLPRKAETESSYGKNSPPPCPAGEEVRRTSHENSEKGSAKGVEGLRISFSFSFSFGVRYFRKIR
jgi:hypothetical protein